MARDFPATDDSRARSFCKDLAQQGHRVVRYDRLGAGLSERTLPGPASIDLDTRVLRSVIDACSDEPATCSRARARRS